MATISRFEDLAIWQLAREFCKDIFRIIQYPSFSTDYRLKDQIRGSSGSVMDNIAEGYERDGNKEFIQFLFIAKASCGETRSQLHRAFDSGYISQDEFTLLYDKAIFLSKSIYNFIAYLKKSDIKGSKFKE
jgi:four helix bundle protein